MKTVAFAAICLLIGCTISAQDDGLPELRPEVMTSYAADFTDDRKLVGAAHNIFVGRVLTKIKMVRHNGRLHTRFEVAIVSNIKGDLQGSIFVDQLSGPRRKYGDVPGGPFWRRLRCSSVTDRCGYAPSSRLASTKNFLAANVTVFAP